MSERRRRAKALPLARPDELIPVNVVVELASQLRRKIVEDLVLLQRGSLVLEVYVDRTQVEERHREITLYVNG